MKPDVDDHLDRAEELLSAAAELNRLGFPLEIARDFVAACRSFLATRGE